jgi:hypothetical protein
MNMRPCLLIVSGILAFAALGGNPTQSRADDFSKGIPHDPELLEKLHAGQLDKVGPDKLDLLAVFRGFVDAGLVLQDKYKSDLGPGFKDYADVFSYFNDPAVAMKAALLLRIHPNYLATAAHIDATGGVNGDWAQTTCRNVLRLILSRSKGASGLGSTGPAKR